MQVFGGLTLLDWLSSFVLYFLVGFLCDSVKCLFYKGFVYWLMS